MLCERCKQNKATVHLTKILNNKKTEIHLCEECARKSEDISFENPFTINNFLAGLLDSVQSSPIKVDYIKTTTCSKCGMSYGKFKELGRLGCSDCYKTFNEKLKPLIKSVHGSQEHTGKVPKKTGSIIRLKREIMNMKKELSRAIDKEEFERAAELRDKIKLLEKDLEINK
ncbi:UvrB/UvrC motif-containing protein [Paramaledivibacter caminithermalis]|jgi:protein arginine kinase activator|uniref:Protein-arginine kinase activator protein McsA n=1 Tax=Paramaledivibacter caminithermalis (strain DSM 15212 / CIP 107654 / DViRD3) TaxID=1121301 RepID=A0A1M6N2C8_PARC5|nr:UvrB/UvrC motif-containing protein [Paramaledivibacter caminithermalis]SHJ89818.1 Protein-arginine kinase activator protein McsA [Paramaledivibacter caminithermalis DSM 15212]